MPQNITSLSTNEAEFLATMASLNKTIFTSEEAHKFWGDSRRTDEALSNLAEGGWLLRLERGTYLIIPLEAGTKRLWSAQALVVAPHLIEPAAVAYWSALHHWQLTEQLPNTTFVQSTKRKRPSEKTVLGMTFRFVTVTPDKYFGVTRGTMDGQPYYVTSREKTLVDAADRPDLSGGAAQLAQALQTAQDLDWERLSDYLLRWPASSPMKRIGYLVEALDLSIPNRSEVVAQWQAAIAPGIVMLEPGEPGDIGQIVTRWKLKVNVDGSWASGGRL